MTGTQQTTVFQPEKKVSETGAGYIAMTAWTSMKIPIERGKFYVGHIEDGEWLQYSIDVLTAGKYDLVLTVSSASGDGICSVFEGSTALSVNIKIPAGPNPHWQKITVKNIPLTPGKHFLRVVAIREGFNFAGISFYYKGA